MGDDSDSEEDKPKANGKVAPAKMLSAKEMNRLKDVLGVKSLAIIVGDDSVHTCDGENCTGHTSFVRSVGFPEGALGAILEDLASERQHYHTEECNIEGKEDMP